MDRWVGKVAVVTGASSGIGAEITKDLAEKGVIVVALARRFERLQELVTNVKGKVYPRQCDVTKESDILSAFRWVEEILGGVDILVNNAAVSNISSLMSGETDKWQAIINTNILAVQICTREALKTMRERGDCGHIFNINSIAGHRVPNLSGITIGTYTASKYAITALTEALRFELQEAKSQIKITSISPGAVATEMLLSIVDYVREKRIPTGKVSSNMLKPEDISEALIYALSTRPGVQVHELIIQPIQ